MTTQNLTQYWEYKYLDYADEIKQSFMKPEIVAKESLYGFTEELDDFLDEHTEDCDYLVRLSANGYMDCTEWTPIYETDDIDWFFDFYVANE
jgi:hypothetical protein